MARASSMRAADPRRCCTGSTSATRAISIRTRLRRGARRAMRAKSISSQQSAIRTGGDTHQSRFGDPAVRTFAQILDEFRQSYVLRYSAQGVKGAGWHAVAVQVPAQPGLTIKSRSGYFGTSIKIPDPLSAIGGMVARVWRGYAATQEHADAYEAMLKPELLPGVSAKKGYRGSHLLRRDAGHEIEFVTILFFDCLDDIKALTGPDYETAVIPERDASTCRASTRKRCTTKCPPPTDACDPPHHQRHDPDRARRRSARSANRCCAAATSSPAPKRRLRYRVDRLIGQGGYGQVYTARRHRAIAHRARHAVHQGQPAHRCVDPRSVLRPAARRPPARDRASTTRSSCTRRRHAALLPRPRVCAPRRPERASCSAPAASGTRRSPGGRSPASCRCSASCIAASCCIAT